MVACVQGLFLYLRQGLVYSVYGLSLKNCLLYCFSLQESFFYFLPILSPSLSRGLLQYAPLQYSRELRVLLLTRLSE